MSVAKKTAQSTMRNTRIYKEILGELVGAPVIYGGRGNIKPETYREYQRIQVAAEKRDSELNKSLAALIVSCLEDDVPGAQVVVDQKSIKGIQLRPDVAVSVDGTDFICIEPTEKYRRRNRRRASKEEEYRDAGIYKNLRYE